jgi:hypothetical protein
MNLQRPDGFDPDREPDMRIYHSRNEEVAIRLVQKRGDDLCYQVSKGRLLHAERLAHLEVLHASLVLDMRSEAAPRQQSVSAPPDNQTLSKMLETVCLSPTCAHDRAENSTPKSRRPMISSPS